MQRRKGKWKKVLAMLLCTANMLGQVVPVTATEAAVITNLAQNAAITTGAADHGYAHLVKENAVDGNPETRWSAEANAEQWISVDLGKEAEITGFRIMAENVEAQKIGKFKIEGSNDGAGYELIYQSEDKTEEGFDLDYSFDLDKSVSYQHVKLTVEALKSGAYPSVSLREFEVKGSFPEEEVTGNESGEGENPETTDPQEPAEVQDPNVNVAQGKSAVASSEEADTVAAANATDGNTTDRTSRWGSKYGDAPHWIYVDLEKEMEVKTVRIFWENRKATNYEIQTATELAENVEDTQWNTVKSFEDRPKTKEDTIILDQVEKARYVRLLINDFTSQDPDPEGVDYKTISIYEMQIFGGEQSSGGEVTEPEEVVDTMENLALGKKAVASSIEAESVRAQLAVDGNVEARESRWGSATTGAPHWIYVDLEETTNIKNIRIFWENRKATEYRIQLANTMYNEETAEADWADAMVISQNPSSLTDVITLDKVHQARYLRLYINSFTNQNPDNSTDTWPTVSIYELEVYAGEIPDSQTEADEVSVVTPQKGDKNLVLNLPQKEGVTYTYNGSDYDELVDDELTIYQPVVDTQVLVSVKAVRDNGEYSFIEIPVTIPGTYTKEEGDNPAPTVLPELREWKGRQGIYSITEETRVLYADPGLKTVAETLAKDYKAMTGKDIRVAQADAANAGDILFSFTQGKGLLKEGYLMDISDKVTVEAEDATGAYWATRTILQSIKASGNIPQGITRDYPLYEVRGFILDVGRKTFTLDYLKQVVQEMAWYKMNDFHVHLNDNLIPLEYYSKKNEDPMQAYSGFRLESDIKKGGNNGLNQADLTSTDVFYTKDEFRQFIQESRNYGVNIIPEIDAPAHSLSFTKVRPDLRHGTWGRDNDHLNLKGKYNDSLTFIESVFDEYMGSQLTDPVFDTDTIVHIGCDEYGADPTAFRNFSNDMIDYVQEKGRTVRVWGSLSTIKADVVVKSENVQMNLWNFGYAKMNEMYEQGFDLINCNDGNYYIVPNAGYYYDYLYDGTMYDLPINSIGGVTIPAGDKQMLGGAFAVWNDMIDYLDNGVSEYDVYDRIKMPIALFGAKLWGKHDLSLDGAKALRNTMGSAPGNNFGYETEAKEGVIASYTMDALEELHDAVNAEITETDGRKALELKGTESFVTTDFTTVGLDNDLRVKVKRTTDSTKEQILFESPYGNIKAVQKETGKVGVSRENFDYSFNYTLPVDEWVELEFKNELNVLKLYVNGKLTDVLGDDEKVEGKPMLATMMFPIELIGSKTNAFVGYVDDVRVGRTAEYNSTMAVDHLTVTANQLTQQSKELKALLEQAKELFKKFAPSAQEVTQLAEALSNELKKAEFEQADYSRVDEYIAMIPKDLGLFTEKSVAVLNQVLSSIRRDLPKSMQSTVDGYEAVLEQAIAGLELIPHVNANYADPSSLKVTASSHHSGGEAPEKVLDNDPNTIWHTKYDQKTYPHWISFELEEQRVLEGITYVPRSGGGNGNFTAFEILISDNGKDFRKIKDGNWKANGEEKVEIFDKTTTRYIRLAATAAQGDFGSAAEIKLHLGDVAPDLNGLNTLINEAKAIEKGNFTQESFEELKEEIKAAEELGKNPLADTNDVELMKRSLSEKIVGLRLMAKNPSTGNNDKPEGGNDKPEGGNDKPEGGNDKPEGGNDKSEGGNDKPEGGSNQNQSGNYQGSNQTTTVTRTETVVVKVPAKTPSVTTKTINNVTNNKTTNSGEQKGTTTTRTVIRQADTVETTEEEKTVEVVETQESIEVAKTPDVAEVTKTREAVVEVEEEPVPLAEMKVEKNMDNTTVLLLCFIGAAAVLVAVFAKKVIGKEKQ